MRGDYLPEQMDHFNLSKTVLTSAPYSVLMMTRVFPLLERVKVCCITVPGAMTPIVWQLWLTMVMVNELS